MAFARTFTTFLLGLVIPTILGITANTSDINNKSSLWSPSPPLSVSTYRVLENVTANITSRYSVMQILQTSNSSRYVSHWKTNPLEQQGNRTFIQATKVKSITLKEDPKATSMTRTAETNSWSSLPFLTKVFTASQTSEPISMTASDTSIASAARAMSSVIGTTSTTSSKSHTFVAVERRNVMTTLYHTNEYIEPLISMTASDTSIASAARVTPLVIGTTSATSSKSHTVGRRNVMTTLYHTNETMESLVSMTASDTSKLTKPISMTESDISIASAARAMSSVIGTTSATASKSHTLSTVARRNVMTTLYHIESMESLLSMPVATASHTCTIQLSVQNSRSVTRVLSSFSGSQNGTSPLVMTMGNDVLSRSTRKTRFSIKGTGAQTSQLGKRNRISKMLEIYSVAEKRTYNASFSNNTTATSSKHSISVTRAMFSPMIFKATSAFSGSYYITKNVETPKHSSFMDTSSFNMEIKSFSTRSQPFPDIDSTTDHFASVHADTTQTLSFTEASNATGTSVAVFINNGRVTISSLPFVQIEKSSIHDTSSSQSKAVFTETIDPGTSVTEPQSATITTVTPTVQGRTSSTSMNTKDVSSGTTSSVSFKRPITWPSLPMVQNKTSRLSLLSSSKISETTDVFSSVLAQRASLEVSSNGTTMGTALLVIQRRTSLTQVDSSSTIMKSTAISSEFNVSRTIVPLYNHSTIRISKAQSSKWQFSSIKDPESVSSSDRVNERTPETTLTATEIMTSVSLISVEAFNTNVRTVGPSFTLRLCSEVASGHQSETSFETQQPLPGTRVITTTPLTPNTANSQLKSLGETSLAFSSPFAERTGDYINVLSTAETSPHVVPSARKDAISMPGNTRTAKNSSVENSLNSFALPFSPKTTGHDRQGQTASTAFPSRPKSVGYTSAVKYSHSKVGGYSSENYRISSVVSQERSSPVVSTPVIFNSPFPNDSTVTLLLTTESVHSHRMPMQQSSQVKLGLTSSPSVRILTEHVPFTSATPRGTSDSMAAKGITSTRNSPSDSSLEHRPISTIVSTITKSMTSRLPTSVSSHPLLVLKSTRILMTTLRQGPSTTYTTASLLPPSKDMLSNTGAISSPPTVTDTSSSPNVSAKQILDVASSAFNELSSFTIVTSSAHTTMKSLRQNISTSATTAFVSLRSQITGENSMATPVSPKNSYTATITKQWTFSTNPEESVTTSQTQTSKKSRVPLSSGRSTNTALEGASSSTAFLPTRASSAVATVQTRSLPQNPKQFEGTIVLQIPWNPQYQIPYTPEFQELATQITWEFTKVLKALEDDFLSVQVLRLWKSSVGVDFVVFMRQSVQINRSELERTLLRANRTGELDLPITSLEVKERTVTTATSSAPTPGEHKPLERWEIILIASGILVFLLFLIICILGMKLVKRSGGFKRRKKYELSTRYSNYVYSESMTRSKSNLPVILSLEEKKECIKEDSYEDLQAYNVTNNKSEEKRLHQVEGTLVQVSELNSNSQHRNLSMGSRRRASEHLYEEPSRYSISDNKGEENLAYKAEGTQFEMRTFKPKPASRDLSEGSTSSAPEEGCVSTEEYPTHRNEGCDEDVIRL